MRLFISKNDSEIDPFRSHIEELGYEIEGHSFLTFSAVEFQISQPFNVIFFTSPRSVNFFLAGNSIPENVEIACIGSKTADLLRELGFSVAFFGRKSGEPQLVAEDFKSWLGSKRTLFPISDRSLKSISGVIAKNQKEEVIVYRTEISSKIIKSCDVYVFTSPSNIEGFFRENEISENAKVVAWGKSCEMELISRSVSVNFTLENSGLEELALLIKNAEF